MKMPIIPISRLAFALIAVSQTSVAQYPEAVSRGVPGTVINYIHSSTGFYIGSPSLAEGPDGVLYASHDLFSGSQLAIDANEYKNRTTLVFTSKDGGKTWEKISEVSGQFWSSLFIRQDELYLIGTNKIFGSIVIRKSLDGGKNWSFPAIDKFGLLEKGTGYHAAPGPIIEHSGRLWKAFEQIPSGAGWGGFRVFLMSVPVKGDLLNARRWKRTEQFSMRAEDFPKSEREPTILEGNVVEMPDGKLGCLYRYYSVDRPVPGNAVLLFYNEKQKKLEFRKDQSWIPFDSPYSKFFIFQDTISKRYWAVCNRIDHGNPAYRSRLALSSSIDLREWKDEGDILVHAGNPEKVGFQYPTAVVSGEDLLLVTRSSLNGASNFHDANYLLFHRIKNFRDASQRVTQRLPVSVPSLVGFGDQKIPIGTVIETPLYFSGDPDNVSIQGLPPGLRYDAELKMILGVPRTAGSYKVSVFLKNTIGSAEPTYTTITVTEK